MSLEEELADIKRIEQQILLENYLEQGGDKILFSEQIPLYEGGYDDEYSPENHYNAVTTHKGYGKEVSFAYAPYKSRINLNDPPKSTKDSEEPGQRGM